MCNGVLRSGKSCVDLSLPIQAPLLELLSLKYFCRMLFWCCCGIAGLVSPPQEGACCFIFLRLCLSIIELMPKIAGVQISALLEESKCPIPIEKYTCRLARAVNFIELSTQLPYPFPLRSPASLYQRYVHLVPTANHATFIYILKMLF
jgi:hypothetical protein